MKKLILLSVIILHTCLATAQWETQSPYPTSQMLWDVYFINENTGWITGNEGTIMYTNDGGNTWTHQESGTLQTLFSLSFIDANNGWTAGESGTILHTVDGGENWMDQYISDTVLWHSVEFKDQNNGWIVGRTSSGYGIIIHTSDAGNNWELQLLEPDHGFNDVCFTSLTSGWTVGDHGIFHTDDGGDTWNEQYNYTGYNPTVSFVDSLNGWVGAGGPSIFMHTSDGGETWIPDTITAHPFNAIIDICFLDIMNGWILCIEGEAGTEWCYPLYTSDGGASWNSCPNYNNIGRYVYAMSFINPETGWVVGNFGSICHTSSGLDWNMQSMITNDKMISDVCFIDDQNGWAIGSSYEAYMASWIMQTNNGGGDWTIHSYISGWLRKIVMIDENNLWIIGGMSLLQTNDGGENWEYHDYFDGINDLFFTDVQNGWATCWNWNNSSGKIYHTSNEGEIWEEQYSSEEEYLQSIYFLDQTTGWVVGKSGDSGVILNTIDEGLTWTNQLYANNHFFIKIYFSDPNSGLAIGIHGSVFQTNNGGENWTQINDGFDVDFSDVFFADLNNIWAIGSIGQYPQPVFEGLIYYSNDNGQTWTEQESGTSQELLGIWFNNSEEGWISGENGTILHTVNGGIAEIPKVKNSNSNLKLKNYPNPFSLNTTIEFTLPNASQISLSIYDINGKQIETILTKKLPMGDNKITWFAKGLNEGIYFFRLETNTSSIVQKAIILK